MDSDKNILNATLLNMTTIVSSTLRCHPTLDAAAYFDCLGYESVFLPLPGWWKSAVVCVCPADAQSECVCMRACAPLLPRCERQSLCVIWRGRLYKIPACWSNGTVGKATIVVLTMIRLSSMELREKCSQFVFCPSRFLTLAVTFKSMPIHSSPLPSPFGPSPGPPLHCFLLNPTFPLPLIPSSLSFPTLFFFIQLQDKLYLVNYNPQDLPHHKSQENKHWEDDNECITSVADVINFQSAILWQCWHSLQHHGPGVLRVTVHISDQMSQGWNGETHMPGKIWKVREWPWLFCHPVEKGKECAKLATVALFLYPDCLSKVEMAFSRVKEGLCFDASTQTVITWEPETVLKYWNYFLLSCTEISLCTEVYSRLAYCTCHLYT